MILIGKRKETRYLLQKQGDSGAETAGQKEQLIRQGYLVVTLIEGNLESEKGVRAVVRNHIH